MAKSFGVFLFYLSIIGFGLAQIPQYPSFTESFATRVEVTDMLNETISKTTIVDEFHDLPEKRGKFKSDNVPVYFFAQMDQAVILTRNASCVQSKLEKIYNYMETNHFGWADKKNSIVGPSAILNKYKPVFQKSNENVRGIICDKFVAKDDTGKVDVTYYLANLNWTEANGRKAVIPVRVTYNGTSKDKPFLKGQIDFLNFHILKAETELMLPEGMGCGQGLSIHQEKKFPKINNEISFTMELFDNRQTNGESVNLFAIMQKMWFDSVNHYVRIQRYDDDSYDEVQDYNTGVSYHLYRNDSCFLYPIQNTVTENQLGDSMGRMKTAREFLNLDVQYYYLGMKYYRNIQCEVWESVVHNQTTDFNTLVLTYYIMAPKIEEVSSGDANVQVPVALIINGYEDTIQGESSNRAVYNFFNFDEAEGRLFLRELNLEKCFSEESQKNYFALYFPVDDAKKLRQILDDKRLFLDETLLEITSSSNVSLIRLPFSEVYVNRNQAVVFALMLNRPPALMGFAASSEVNFQPTSDMDDVSPVTNAEECAVRCLNYNKFTCRVFATCNHPKQCDNLQDCNFLCYVGKDDLNNGTSKQTLPGQFNGCEAYSRAVAEEATNELDLMDALKALNESVNSGKVVVTLYDTRPEKEIGIYNYVANRLETGLKPFNDFNHDILFETAYNGFQLKNSKDTFMVYDQLATPELCYERCKSDDRLACASFSYCSLTGVCRLNGMYLSVDDASSVEHIEVGSSCKIFRKRDLDFFEETPGMVPKMPGVIVFENVPDENACAVWCKSYKKLTCRAFEYCPQTKSCVLHQTHNIKSELEKSENVFCKHYALKYSSEFTMSPGYQIVNDPKHMEMSQISFEDCAKTCRENFNEFQCRSINYCPANVEVLSTCMLNTLAIYDKAVQTINTDRCQHYSLSYDQKEVPQFKPMSQWLKTGYQTKIEVTRMTDRGTTVTYFVDEFHNLERQSGRIERHLKEGLHSRFYYFSDSKQVVAMNDQKCKVSSYDEVTFVNRTLDWEWLDNSTTLIAGPSSVLWRETVSPPVAFLDPVPPIRGIPCYKYTAVLKNDREVSIEYYLAESSWTDSSGKSMLVPIRVVAVGTYTMDGKKLPLNMQLDFISFKAGRPSFDVFQLEAGVGCEGLKSNGKRTFPRVEDQFSYIGEAYNIYKADQEIQSHVVLFRVWFDGVNKMVRVDASDEKLMPYSSVSDFNTGVEYTTFPNGTCVMGGIKNSPAQDGPSGVVRNMRDGNQFLGFDGEYYYLGRGLTRSVYCDIWETVKTDIYLAGGLFYKRVVQTVYFMSPDSESVVSSDSNVQVPVKIEMRLQKDAKSPVMLMDYNTFAFDEAEGRYLYKDLDVERCYLDEVQKDHFMVYFPLDAQTSMLISQNEKRVELEARLAFVEAADVSMLRIPSVKIYKGVKTFSILGTILEKPPTIAGFYLYARDEEPYNSEKEVMTGVKSSDDCANFCVSDKTCKGFTYCKSKVKCFLSTNDVADDWGKPQDEYKECDLYFRSDLNSRANEPSLKTALSNLEKKVYESKVKVTVSLSPDPFDVTAIGIEERLTPFNWQDTDTYDKVFDKLRLASTSETVTNKGTVATVNDCYQLCQNEKKTFCSSFSYCTVDRNCRLTSLYLDSNKPSSLDELDGDAATSCAVYRKGAIKFFDKTPGMTAQVTGEKFLESVASEDECAFKCRQESGFPCKGFEFCDGTRSCVLHSKHALDLPPLSEGKPLCSHYSLKYSVEFSDLGRFELVGPSSVNMTVAGFEDCSKACYESTDFGCLSFNYCPGGDSLLGASCALVPATVSTKGYELKESNSCSTYFSKREVLKPQPVMTADPDRVPKGRFAGTIIGVMIFGIVLGVGAFILYSVWRSRHQSADGLSVKFINTP